MNKKIFITGSEGFVGKKLCKFLESKEYDVFGYSQQLENHEVLKSSLSNFNPDVVIHLAGLSNLLYCEEHPDRAYFANTAGTSILVENMLKLAKRPNMIFASSAQVYNLKSGKVSEKPIDESFEIVPTNVYGRTKLESEYIIKGMSEIYNFKSVALRLFNHTHKDQLPEFFLPSMYKQINEINDGGVVRVGNLNVSRDFSLVNDLLIVIEAIIKKFNVMQTFEFFNVCSGQARNLRELVESMARQMGKKVDFVEEAERVRKDEPVIIVGSGEKLKNKLGFSQPVRSVDEYIKCFIE